MKIKLSSLILIGSIVSSVLLNSCIRRDNDSSGDDEATIEKGTFDDNRDGKSYKWVKIGNQVWMAENLAYTGDDIEHNPNWMGSNSGYNSWCYYDNNSTNGEKYGVLYQWGAAQIACPSGWHLPSHTEWIELIDYLADHGYSYDGYTGVRDIAKSLASNEGWATSSTEGAVGNTDYPEVQNKTGFTALPAGKRTEGGEFKWLSTDTFWWTASEYATPSAFYHTINNVQPYENFSNANEGSGFSVRCIKD